MKKVILQKISDLCCFALDDQQCIKFLRYLIIGDITSARLYLDKCIVLIEWEFSFNENDDSIRKQLQDTNSLMDAVMELSILNERKHKTRKRIRRVIE